MDQDTQDLAKVIKIDEGRIRDHVGEIVRGSVEDTLNALLDAEADRPCQAKRYERTASRKETRAGHYQRKLQTRAGEVKLKADGLSAATTCSYSACAPAGPRGFRRGGGSIFFTESHAPGLATRDR